MQAILFDLDGVIYQEGEAVAGAVATLDWVRHENIPHLFVTNTTSRPAAGIVERLRAYGADVDAASILTPPIAARRWLEENAGNGAIALFVPAATRAEFSGFDWLAENAETGAAAVIVGDFGEGWDFHTLNRAFRLLQSDAATALIALGMTRYWRAQDGLRLDTGPFVRALEYASGKSALVLGKPAEQFFAIAVNILACRPVDTLMIGDDIRSDIEGAQRAGLKGLLVKTGKFRDRDLDGNIQPDAILESVADLPDWWKDNASEAVT